MRFNYKPYPYSNALYAFPEGKERWQPVIPVQISDPSRHTPPTRRFEAYVDSGSPFCYFQKSIGRAVGIKIERGPREGLGGLVGGPVVEVFFHDIAVHVGSEIVKVRAGFCDLAVAGVLGRTGFFDQFVVTFDQSAVPPFVELSKIPRN